MAEPVQTCTTCPHLLAVERQDFYPPRPQYFCEAAEGKAIGFVAVRPDWCPILTDDERAEKEAAKKQVTDSKKETS